MEDSLFTSRLAGTATADAFRFSVVYTFGHDSTSDRRGNEAVERADVAEGLAAELMLKLQEAVVALEERQNQEKEQTRIVPQLLFENVAAEVQCLEDMVSKTEYQAMSQRAHEAEEIVAEISRELEKLHAEEKRRTDSPAGQDASVLAQELQRVRIQNIFLQDRCWSLEDSVANLSQELRSHQSGWLFQLSSKCTPNWGTHVEGGSRRPTLPLHSCSEYYDERDNIVAVP